MSNNKEHNEHFEELCSAYVLNALEADEQQEFEELLQEADQDQRQTFLELRSAANQLAFTVDRAEPSADVKDQLMKRIGEGGSQASITPIDSSSHQSDTAEDTSGGFSRSALAMAASFALLLITLALVFYAFNLNSELNNRDEVIAERNATITELKNDVQQKEELLSILEARTVDLVAMDGLDVNPNGYGKIIWDAEKQQALLQVSNLPEVPQGKAYQLWLIRDNKPVPSATFTVGRQDKGSFFKIEQLANANQQNANAFAITLEPETGSQQPTGDMYLLGNVGS